ncbi:hypothetical protein ACRYCC_12315 [Actinomadura scrupuli]|uniref:hypothetical protein n=1 Tax=Actinomadura scrupuli TaxID=559629 RepID=UPI003D97F13F
MAARTSIVVCLVLAGLTSAGCGGDASPKKSKSASSASAGVSSPTSPPPHFTSQQVLRGLLKAKDIGPRFKQTIIGTRALLEGKALMCSQSGVKLPGKPETGLRQYTASVRVSNDMYYSQFIALYPDQKQADGAFAALKAAATACPPKQHVASRKDSTTNATLFAHDDTWTLAPQDVVQNWTHLHGWERGVFHTHPKKDDIIFYSYDYSVRGNLVIVTLYSERTVPKDSGDAISKRASTVLSKQLKALG